MLLAIDARNAGLELGFYARSALSSWERVASYRLSGEPSRSADEYALLFEAFAARACASAGGRAAIGEAKPGAAASVGSSVSIEEAWMSCVVPTLMRPIDEAVRRAFGIESRAVGPGTRSGLRIRTDVPSELGADLVCAAVAARELAKGPCIIADFDAATAFVAVSATGELLGAAIAPGIAASAASLHSSAALLPEVSLSGPCRAVGKNTAEAIRAGIRFGFAGLVERIVAAQAAELAAAGEAGSAAEVELIATGSEEGRETIEAIGIGRFVPDLVLDGLALIASLHQR